MARHTLVAIRNSRGQEASDDESRKKRCTVPSPQREAVSGAEQALRDYDDYLSYYGLKEYCTQYADYADCVDKLATDAGAVESSASDEDELNEASVQFEARELGSVQGDNETPDHLTASVSVDTPAAACDHNCACESLSATQEEENTRDNVDTWKTQSFIDPHASIPVETSWAWALNSVGHVRVPSTSSSCTADSEGAASSASSWAKVGTPVARRKNGGSMIDNEWEVVQVLAPDEESTSFL